MNDKEFFEKMGLDGDTLKNVFNTIRTTPPIHIINLDDTTDHMYVGKYLLSLENDDLKQKLEKFAKPDKMKPTSIIFFENRHIEELARILYGVFMAYDIEDTTRVAFIYNFVEYLTKPHIYSDFIYNVRSKIMKEFYKTYYTPIEFKNRIDTILTYIWFIPYGGIDDIIEYIKEDYLKSGGKLDGNNIKSDRKSEE